MFLQAHNATYNNLTSQIFSQERTGLFRQKNASKFILNMNLTNILPVFTPPRSAVFAGRINPSRSTPPDVNHLLITAGNKHQSRYQGCRRGPTLGKGLSINR